MCLFTGTFDAVADPAWSTVTLEAACRVGARGVTVTVVSSDLTLVDV